MCRATAPLIAGLWLAGGCVDLPTRRADRDARIGQESAAGISVQVRDGLVSLPRFGGQFDYAASLFADNLNSNSTGLM
jgi:hypothetical protein